MSTLVGWLVEVLELGPGGVIWRDRGGKLWGQRWNLREQVVLRRGLGSYHGRVVPGGAEQWRRDRVQGMRDEYGKDGYGLCKP